MQSNRNPNLFVDKQAAIKINSDTVFREDTSASSLKLNEQSDVDKRLADRERNQINVIFQTTQVEEPDDDEQ